MDLELGPLKPEPVELLVGLACFFLVLWLLGRVVLPRAERVLAERRDATEGRLERAAAIVAEAERTLDEYRQELAAARHEAAHIRQQAAEEGAAAIATAREEGLRERDLLLAEADARLAVDRAFAEAALREDVGQLATELAGRLVGESVAAVAAERRTAERFFDELPAAER
nr:F0F1 ATP synthase subunit B [Kitasatospora purpeofusca]